MPWSSSQQELGPLNPDRGGHCRLTQASRPTLIGKADDWDGWNTALLSHHQPVRGKFHTLQLLPQISLYNSSANPLGSLGSLNISLLFSLVGPYNKTFSAPNTVISICWPQCASGTELGFENRIKWDELLFHSQHLFWLVKLKTLSHHKRREKQIFFFFILESGQIMFCFLIISFLQAVFFWNIV